MCLPVITLRLCNWMELGQSVFLGDFPSAATPPCSLEQKLRGDSELPTGKFPLVRLQCTWVTPPEQQDKWGWEGSSLTASKALFLFLLGSAASRPFLGSGYVAKHLPLLPKLVDFEFLSLTTQRMLTNIEHRAMAWMVSSKVVLSKTQIFCIWPSHPRGCLVFTILESSSVKAFFIEGQLHICVFDSEIKVRTWDVNDEIISRLCFSWNLNGTLFKTGEEYFFLFLIERRSLCPRC